MDLYAKKSRWKLYLGILGALIIAISMYYTNYLVKQLEEEETKKVTIWAAAYEKINDSNNLDADLTLNLAIIEANTSIPIILVNDGGGIDDIRNFGAERDTSRAFLKSEELKKELASIKAEKREAIPIDTYKIYYKHSRILVLLRYFPIVQMILIATFILFGYLGFSNARRSEQNQVWAGMAKETAHQLGTPISAIIGWIEHLRMTHEEDEATNEVLNELDNDVARLQLIADRFSKIGSAPVLESINIISQLDKCRAYMQKRSPRHVVFDFPDINQKPIMVNINQPLFDWVIENLLRNSLDAMDGKGNIRAQVYEDSKQNICIDISDTGKGIPQNKFKTVFEPGYTTKKRGWGLGLSLVKRIVDEYHKGKIFVARSTPTEGTTFTIKLPKG